MQPLLTVKLLRAKKLYRRGTRFVLNHRHLVVLFKRNKEQNLPRGKETAMFMNKFATI